MEVAETEAKAGALEVLAEVAGVLERRGLQEESELPAQILAEFVMDSQKKDRLLCSQLQVVDFLQNFLAQDDTAQGLDPLASEDLSRQKAIAAKEQWKELKATYREHVEAIRSALTQALIQEEEVHRKQTQLQEAFEQLQAKKQIAMEKLRAAQKQWQLQQEKCLQHLVEVSTEGKLLLPEAETQGEAENLPEDKPQQLTQPQEQNTGDTMEKDGGVSFKAASPQPAGDVSLPW
uniref:ZW10 interacting kinetochore protein n=1 Tax=Propithecus coquereli TaxID=379532 RepID=A0A2K6FZ60_PROCO